MEKSKQEISYNSREYKSKYIVYRNQIEKNSKLEKAFSQLCDIHFKKEKDLIDDLNCLLGNGNCESIQYNNLYPFAESSAGDVYVLLDYECVGIVTSEGQCGIVANNISEFFNIISVCKGYLDLFDGKGYEKFENFRKIKETLDLECEKENLIIDGEKATDILEKFILDNSFSKDIQELYEMFRCSVYKKPAFVIKAKNDNYVDYDSLIFNLENSSNKNSKEEYKPKNNIFSTQFYVFMIIAIIYLIIKVIFN